MDLTLLNAAIERARAQAEKTAGTEDSAAVIIAAIREQVIAAVTAALTADAAANQGSIDIATKAINDTMDVIAEHDDKLGAAIAANQTPTAPVSAPNPA